MTALNVITIGALAAPWPILGFLGWIFYRSARDERRAADGD